jgi:hypothetical protein
MSVNSTARRLSQPPCNGEVWIVGGHVGIYRVFRHGSDWVVAGDYTGHVYSRHETREQALVAAEAMPVPHGPVLGYLP